MATYINQFKQNQNNLEAMSCSKAFGIEFERDGSDGRRPTEQGIGLPYVGGDVIVIGTIPGGSIVTDIRVLVNDGFDATTTLDIGYSADYPSLSISPAVETPLLVATDNVAVLGEITVNGNVDSVGTPLSAGDPKNGIWMGTADKMGDYYITATIGGVADGVALTQGNAEIIVTYSRFSTNIGAY